MNKVCSQKGQNKIEVRMNKGWNEKGCIIDREGWRKNDVKRGWIKERAGWRVDEKKRLNKTESKREERIDNG